MKSEVGGKSSVYREIRGFSPSKVVHEFGYLLLLVFIPKRFAVRNFFSL
jgi:hypothetical protein